MNEGYVVYRHIFPNGKSYIGITKQGIDRRYRNGAGYENQNKINNAIRKYGWENIKHEIIAENLTLNDAKRIEIENIDKFDSVKNGYNTTYGGGGVKSKALLSAKATNVFSGIKNYFTKEQNEVFDYMSVTLFYAYFINELVDYYSENRPHRIYGEKADISVATWNHIQEWIGEELKKREIERL